MEKKANIRLLALILPMAALFSGCMDKQVYQAPADRTSDPITLHIAWWGGEDRRQITEQVLELYTELHPEVVFDTLPSDWDDYFEKLALETAQGNMPDLVQMDYQYITTYTENGALADLTPFVENGIIQTDDMDENILRSGIIDGKRTGIPLGTSLISFIYNPSVFQEAGLTPPGSDWTWEDFASDCVTIQQKTGKYGAAMTPILDMNLFHCWVRQKGYELFLEDGQGLGYPDDAVYVEYVSLFKRLIDAGAVTDSDHWAAISARGQENLPVVTGDCGLMQEWNNFPVKMQNTGARLCLVTPPLDSETNASGLWQKPSMFFSVAETSPYKEECARFIDWFLHDPEANALLCGERGVPISRNVRETLMESADMPELHRTMFRFSDDAIALCGSTPPPEPSGIESINEAFAETANACFYGVMTAEDAAAQFRRAVETRIR